MLQFPPWVRGNQSLHGQMLLLGMSVGFVRESTQAAPGGEGTITATGPVVVVVCLFSQARKQLHSRNSLPC